MSENIEPKKSMSIDWPPIPPAVESMAKIRTMKPFPKKKVLWGYREMLRLAKEVWPEMPEYGADFDEVLRRAREARQAQAGNFD